MQVNSFAAAYEKAADPNALKAVQTFYKAVTSHHSFPTGKLNMLATLHAFYPLSSPTANVCMLVDQRVCKLHRFKSVQSFQLGGRQPHKQHFMLKIARGMLLSSTAAPLCASLRASAQAEAPARLM